MKLSLHAIGRRMPAWVADASAEYQKRFPRQWQFSLREFPQAKGQHAEEIMQREADQLLAAIPDTAFAIALDNRGALYSTEDLADKLALWQGMGKDLVLMIGGADGLHPRCRERADALWSLSPLTFPHPLVRVIVLEQLYRAQSILDGHPYHRG